MSRNIELIAIKCVRSNCGVRWNEASSPTGQSETLCCLVEKKRKTIPSTGVEVNSHEELSWNWIVSFKSCFGTKNQKKISSLVSADDTLSCLSSQSLTFINGPSTSWNLSKSRVNSQFSGMTMTAKWAQGSIQKTLWGCFCCEQNTAWKRDFSQLKFFALSRQHAEDDTRGSGKQSKPTFHLPCVIIM